ncbi:hypothetical protein, partial [Ruegeria intermedia]|uniref:hypothetical protein n=1 Tax=Ruegeria intermedia TaxID=996115 RepID=UPI00165F6531
VRAQIDKNTKEQALKGNLPGAVQGAVVRAMTSNNALASLLLKSDKQGLGILTNMIYDILKSGNDINLDDLDAACLPQSLDSSTQKRFRDYGLRRFSRAIFLSSDATACGFFTPPYEM